MNSLSLIESATLKQVHQIHAHLLTHGFLSDPHHLGKFISVLALSHKTPSSLPYSHQLLLHSPSPPNVFALNSLIRAHSKSTSPLQSFQYYNQVLRSGLPPDHYTFTFLVRSSAHLPSAGPAVHGSAIKFGFGSDPHVQSGLIHMYSELGSPGSASSVYSELRSPDLISRTAMLGALASSGDVGRARELFDEMPHRDPVAWNAMIAGFSQAGRSREALELFRRMQSERVRVTEATMVSVLTACAHLGALDQGRWAHGYVQRRKLRLTVTLGTALVDMYSKCGSTERAMEVFGLMAERNVYTWSSAMGGLAMNGLGRRCLELFEEMEREGVEPNGVTFVAVLRGCSVAGLVERGREHFDSMRARYGIEPWSEHYGCMVDLYARAGRLDDALGFLDAMPVEPHAGAWGALLNACRIHRNVEVGELAMSRIVGLESGNDGAYVQLSNIYAGSERWEGVSGVRELMRSREVRKEPGCSVVEVGGEAHEFFAGDRSHRRYGEVEAMLGEMARRLRLAGYVARTEEVLFDVDEEEKEGALGWHSEKLAIAFGLVASPEGAAIRVVKNLRVCLDCHDAAKLLSKVFDREIVLRDRNRFHHFRNGVCSCNDYW